MGLKKLENLITIGFGLRSNSLLGIYDIVASVGQDIITKKHFHTLLIKQVCMPSM